LRKFLQPHFFSSRFSCPGTLLTAYNSITADYEIKPNIEEPQPGACNYAPGDYIVAYAVQPHLRMHGHNLIWHHGLPDSALHFQGDSSAREALFATHIQGQATHYKGMVARWDVAKIALRDDNGALRNIDATPGDGSGRIWRQHLGADYVPRGP